MSEDVKIQEQSEEERPAKLLQFPCDFPLKIVGIKADDYKDKIVEVIKKYDPDYNPAEANLKESAKGNYLSLGVVVRATSQDQLDDLYKALVDHEYTKFVL